MNATTPTSYPDTITFERDGREHLAVVGPPHRPVSDALVVEHDGVRYAISIPLGSIPGYPDASFIALPVKREA